MDRKKTPQQALDTAVERGNQLLRALSSLRSLNSLTLTLTLSQRRGDRSAWYPGAVSVCNFARGKVCTAFLPRPSGERAGVRGHNTKSLTMSSSRPVFRSRWRPICWSRRSSSSPLSFLSGLGRSVVVLAAKRRSVWFLQPVVGLDNFVTLFHDSYYLDSF